MSSSVLKPHDHFVRRAMVHRQASRVENFDELVQNTVKSLSKEAEAKAIAEQLRAEGEHRVERKENMLPRKSSRSDL